MYQPEQRTPEAQEGVQSEVRQEVQRRAQEEAQEEIHPEVQQEHQEPRKHPTARRLAEQRDSHVVQIHRSLRAVPRRRHRRLAQ